MSRLLIVSNRLPYTLERSDEGLALRQSSGGLVSAIKSFFERDSRSAEAYTEKIWIGSMESTPEEWKEALSQTDVEFDFVIEPIFPEESIYENYYNGFSNSVVWPLFHYFPSLVEHRREYFEAYRDINLEFCHRILSVVQPGDVIWIHDYHLMMLPKLLRDRMKDATIGFFLHIPFPSYELLRLMPTEWKRSILEGLLGADLVGFHTYDYVQHFIQSARMIVQAESHFNNIGYMNRIVRTDSFPIGIDYEKFRQAITDEEVVSIATSLEEKFYNQKLIFSVDRLDYTKGLNFRLEGYEEFLLEHPEWHEKVVFILNVVPSRDDIQAYSDRRRRIEEKVSMINGKFSSLHWQPVIYRYNHLAFEELAALYQVADVALITPLRDGMNLVAKEYIASCIDKGVLVLSELTGAASELSEAVLVNPTDIHEVADSISLALNMPLVEQRSRLSYMQRRLAAYDVVKWLNDFLGSLIESKKDQEEFRVNLLKPATIDKIRADFENARNRCILLDYDGTLAPYQKLPAMAVPSQELLHLLAQLSDTPRMHVVIISGRDAKTLEGWLGHLPLTLVAEHGAMVRMEGEEWKEMVSITEEWKDQVRPLIQGFVDRCAGSFLEEKKSTVAWHYRNTQPELGFTRSRELRNSLLQLTANTQLQVIDGNKVLEVRMVGVDKGTTAVNILAGMDPDFILCLGDDTTDEDMFRMLRDRGYTIKIGSGQTAAEFTISGQQEVFPFLRYFIDTAVSRQAERENIMR